MPNLKCEVTAKWKRGDGHLHKISSALQQGDQLVITITNASPPLSAVILRYLAPILQFDSDQQKILSDAMEKGTWEGAGDEVHLIGTIRFPEENRKKYFVRKIHYFFRGHEPLQQLKVVRCEEIAQ